MTLEINVTLKVEISLDPCQVGHLVPAPQEVGHLVPAPPEVGYLIPAPEEKPQGQLTPAKVVAALAVVTLGAALVAAKLLRK